MIQFTIFIAVTLVLIYLVLAQRFFNTAKEHDPVYFQELGSPHIIMNNRPKHSGLLLKAIFTRNYKNSKSTEVTRSGNAVTLLFWITLLSYGCLIYVIINS